ncbi:hypothetical protein FB562_2607 [Homoserinimonas aerilata]|uniref:N-acetyltransferase domain-containing protein n=1 Tax=Homoserinimonas aerilata TaxID=1162970 RepID=A0A542Y1Q9_9MICO|nr:hypothetical protein [Homoserinimonas aerilata]TQL40462.1 hypothetical protein FB562_2671 [Homoserinimonas aerilata]TQL42017.1 hypothetical protein FB562_2607 [Homoserinimonas aerilata]
MTRGEIEVRPIARGDAEAVARFLSAELNPRVPLSAWAALLDPPWQAEAPNSGFQLVAGTDAQGGAEIVGVYIAVYSEREVEGVRRRFCNLAAFCVREEHRAQSFRLLRAILGQKGFEFTDLSPSGNVVELNRRLGFVPLDTTTRLLVNLPSLPRRGLEVTDDAATIERTLTGADARLFRDHRDAPAARHLLAVDGEEYAYLVYRRDRRKGLPLFASPLYLGGSAALLATAWPQIASRLLLGGAVATLAEHRVLGRVPALGVTLKAPRAKMFRSAEVTAQGIDYLYSELTLLEW